MYLAAVANMAALSIGANVKQEICLRHLGSNPRGCEQLPNWYVNG